MTLVDIPHGEFSKQLCCFTSLPFKCEARTLINLSRWDMFLLFHTAVEIKLQDVKIQTTAQRHHI